MNDASPAVAVVPRGQAGHIPPILDLSDAARVSRAPADGEVTAAGAAFVDRPVRSAEAGALQP